jgi:hypothetical protein
MDSYQLSVVKIEGVKEISNSYCYVYLGPNILRVLTLEHFDIHPIPISKGTLKFVIEDSSSSKLIASLSFPSDVFKRVGFHWMPLYFAGDSTVTQVPDEVSLPRILFDIQVSLLSPVPELTEDSGTYEDVSEDISMEDPQITRCKNITLGVRIMELENQLYTQKKSFEEELDQVKSITNNLNFNLKNQEEINARHFATDQERIREINSLQNSLRFETISRAQAEEKLESFVSMLEEIKHREASILAMLEQKDIEIFNLNKKIPKTPDLSINSCQSLSVFNAKSNDQQEFSSQLPKLIREKEAMAKKIQEIESKTLKVPLKVHEEIESKVKKYLLTKKLENFAVLCNELVYTLGNKKVNLFIKNDELYCKSGSMVKKLESYVQTNCTQDIENYKKKFKSDSHKRINNSVDFEKIGSSIILKTFDGTVRNKSNKRLNNVESLTPTRTFAFSPVSKKGTNR